MRIFKRIAGLLLVSPVIVVPVADACIRFGFLKALVGLCLTVFVLGLVFLGGFLIADSFAD